MSGVQRLTDDRDLVIETKANELAALREELLEARAERDSFVELLSLALAQMGRLMAQLERAKRLMFDVRERERRTAA